MKSLLIQHHALSSARRQLEILDDRLQDNAIPFKDNLANGGLYPLKPTGIEILQVNLGKQCNQTCRHCHVDAGPDRKEKMSRELIETCLKILGANSIPVMDITGGAPEMHPDFRWFVEQCSLLRKKIMVRCNLTIILANKKFNDLPEFFKKHHVEVISSLPFYNADRTNRQRGEGVFEKSIVALKMLNHVGYGLEGSDLKLNLVYNPSGAFLPGSQSELEFQFKKILLSEHDIRFHNLYTITNMPVSRFLDYLLTSGNYENYMNKLVQAFNFSAAKSVMCRNTISIGWDGSIYDCDFNQMLEVKVERGAPQHIMNFDLKSLNEREIVIKQHCYGCTAGAGSSCGGAIT